MMYRLRRLIHGEKCAYCSTRRRVRWYYDTGCCSHACLMAGLFETAVEEALLRSER